MHIIKLNKINVGTSAGRYHCCLPSHDTLSSTRNPYVTRRTCLLARSCLRFPVTYTIQQPQQVIAFLNVEQITMFA